MEVIDISKFYRFQSIPNPLLFSSDLINLDSGELYKFNEIEDLNYNPKLETTINKVEFDNVLKNYSLKNNKLKKKNKEFYYQKSKIQEQLNKIKLYLIVRLTNINDEPVILLPFNNLENLSNNAVSRLYLHRDGLFEINANSNLYFNENPPGERRFYVIDDILTTEGVFDSELDVKLKNITFETEDEILNRKGLKDKLLGDDPNYYSSLDYETNQYLPDLDPEPEIWREEDKNSIWMQKYGIPKQDYEYDEAEIDNVLFNNPIKYLIGTEKVIFPVFESLQDAENFLIKTFEELLEPYRRKRILIKQKDFLNLSKKEQYILLLPSSYILLVEDAQIFSPRDLDSLDNFTQYINLILPRTNIEKIKYWCAKHRLIKSYTKIEPPYQIDNYDQNAFLSKQNSLLLNYTTKTKIVEIGLGDFWDIWVSKNIIKKDLSGIQKKRQDQLRKLVKQTQLKGIEGEILFIPSLSQKPSPSKVKAQQESKKLKEFYNYQKIFEDLDSAQKNFKISYEIGKTMSISELEELLNKK